MTYTCPSCKVERTSLDCGQCLAQKLVDMHDAQKKRADEAEATLAEAVELLKELEWSGKWSDGTSCCPHCSQEARPSSFEAGKFVGYVDGVHDRDCRLAALIGKAGA